MGIESVRLVGRSPDSATPVSIGFSLMGCQYGSAGSYDVHINKTGVSLYDHGVKKTIWALE